MPPGSRIFLPLPTHCHRDVLEPVMSTLAPACILVVGARTLEDADQVQRVIGAYDGPTLMEVSTGPPLPDSIVGRFDGLHVTGNPGAVTALRKSMPAGTVLGATATSRHDAMLAGEGGVDYLAFRADAAPSEGLDLAAWWVELFEIPCVLMGIRPDTADMAQATGAEFLAPHEECWTAADPCQAFRDVLSALGGR